MVSLSTVFLSINLFVHKIQGHTQKPGEIKRKEVPSWFLFQKKTTHFQVFVLCLPLTHLNSQNQSKLGTRCCQPCLLRNVDFSDLANRTACSVLILNNDKLSAFINIQDNIFSERRIYFFVPVVFSSAITYSPRTVSPCSAIVANIP